MDIARDEGSLPATAAISDQPQYVQGQASSVSFRPIEARQSNDPVMSLEERVSQGLARKQANRKAREQQRRDRLKDALDRLAHVVPQEYAISFESDSSLSARRGEPTVRDAKVDIVESAIQYITEMKEGKQGKQRQLQQPPPAGENASKSGTDDE